MVLHNPFTPSFGIIPPYMAGREDLIEELSNAFSNGLGDPNLSTIVSGPRGSGKTALLSFVAEEAASQGWISANHCGDRNARGRSRPSDRCGA